MKDYGKLNNKRLMYFSAWIMKKRMTMTVKEFEQVSIHEALVEYENSHQLKSQQKEID